MKSSFIGDGSIPTNWVSSLPTLSIQSILTMKPKTRFKVLMETPKRDSVFEVVWHDDTILVLYTSSAEDTWIFENDLLIYSDSDRLPPSRFLHQNQE